MNIQGANILSLLSGSENMGNLQQGLSGLTGDEAGFGAALMQQLGVLQNSLGADGNAATPDLATIKSWVKEAAAGGDVSQGLQNFAALFGQDLPAARTANSTIDLEDTLQTLAGVLQQLQELETDSQVPPATVALANTVDSQADNPVDDAESLQTEFDPPAVMVNPMPVAVPLEEIAGQLDEPVEISGFMADVKKPTTVLSQEAQAQTVKIDASANNESTSLDFDRSISALLARDDSNSNSNKSQDKTALDVKSESVLNQLNDGVDSVDANKTTPNISADISRMNNAVSSQTSATVPNNQLALLKNFTDPGWNKELGEKLIWMQKQSIPSVELRLNPEHLGPVLVKIDMSQDQASVAFTAQHLAVKDAIEAAIPKLREMMNGQQVNLVEVNVSQQQSDQRQQARDFFQMASEQGQRQRANADLLSSGAVNEAQDIVDEIEAGRAIASNGLLSLFA